MKTLWQRACALILFAAVATLVVAPGCVEAEAMFFVAGAKVRSCEGTSIDSDDLGAGSLDVRYGCEYSVFLQLGNQLVRRGNDTTLKVETSRISITSYDVEVLNSVGDVIDRGADGPAAFSFTTTGFVDPASTSQPGFGLALVTLIDGATARTFLSTGGGLVTARVTIHGRTLGGDDISTRPWDFPITIYNGRLCVEPADDSCLAPESAPKGLCYIRQDAEFDCRFLLDENGGHSCSEPAECGVF